jgi:hypothetical protein
MSAPKPVKPQTYKLKVAFPKLSLQPGHKVFQHPVATCAPDRMPVALEPRADACWFPVLLTDVEPVVEVA